MLVDTLISSAIWTILQVILFQWPDLSSYKLKRVPYLDFRNRMVSFIHGLLAIALSFYCMISQNAYCGTPTTQLEYGILIMSSGYFSYDFLAMAYFKLLDFDMTVHHLLCIFGMMFTLHQEVGANHVVSGLFVAEISNPAMHMRILLKHIGLRYSRAYEIAEFCYFTTFFIGRMIVGHPVVYYTVTCEKMNYLGRFVSLGVLAQSYQFLYRMYFIVVRRF